MQQPNLGAAGAPAQRHVFCFRGARWRIFEKRVSKHVCLFRPDLLSCNSTGPGKTKKRSKCIANTYSFCISGRFPLTARSSGNDTRANCKEASSSFGKEMAKAPAKKRGWCSTSAVFIDIRVIWAILSYRISCALGALQFSEKTKVDGL